MQTAVQFIIDDIIKNVGEESYYAEANKEPRMVLEKALAMEKEQIDSAYDAGLFDGSMDDVNDRLYKNYYNQTYKHD